MDFTADDAVLFSDFATPATVGAQTFTGIFDAAGGVSPEFGGMIDGGGPTYLCREPVSVDASVTVAGRTWRVAACTAEPGGLHRWRLRA